jgi:hypothetical protein
MVVWEENLKALWHMCAGEEETELDKKRALQIGGAFFTRLYMPLISDPATDAFVRRSSPPQRAKWLGLTFHHLGYRLEGEEGYDAAKDITDLPQVDTDSNNANWRKLSKNINTELADEVHSYINSLTMDGGWAVAMNLAIGHRVLAPAPDLTRQTLH